MFKKKKENTKEENIFKKESNNKIAIILGLLLLGLMLIPSLFEVFQILLGLFW